jgi:drug/metabolite transporter (DMT)-like permease
MVALALAILSSFSISLLVKHNEVDGIDTLGVLASNYASAALIGWGFALNRGQLTPSTPTLWLSLGGSLLWPGTFFLLMWGIRRYGIALAGSISRLSLSVPVLFGLLFLGETPTPQGVLGILTAFAACILLNPKRRGSGSALDRNAVWYVPVLILSFGFADLWVNLFNTLGRSGERDLFTAMLFTGAGVITGFVTLIKGRRPDRRAVVRGLTLGVPNYFSTFFLMRSLQTPAFADASAVAYALYSAASVSLAFAAGALGWREKLSRVQFAGLVVAIAAVVLLNFS